MLNKIVSKRRVIQALFAALLFLGTSYFKISLLYVIIFGSLIGIVFGKVFCRWMCPIGFIMELILGANSDNSQQQLYMYYKLGCPIAWISGLLNKFSLFKIKKNNNTCISCGICDKTCYVALFNKNYSLYKDNSKRPSEHYSCSKCLDCVNKCPTNSLSYRI